MIQTIFELIFIIIITVQRLTINVNTTKDHMYVKVPTLKKRMSQADRPGPS